jgi:hypothetical protein
VGHPAADRCEHRPHPWPRPQAKFAGAGKAIFDGSSYEPQLRDCRPAQHALQGGEQQAGQREASIRTRKLFVVLQSAYGTAFLAKFSTGELNERREDKACAPRSWSGMPPWRNLRMT